MTRLVLEQHFDEPVDEGGYDRMAKRVDPCLEAHGAVWVRSAFSADRRHFVCEFEAADAEAVRVAYRSAGVAFTRVWVATVYEGADFPEARARIEAHRRRFPG
ncbi:MAG TPA: nickel-binding protein [Haliangiales bacterium]|nr:nickel-binding protein [Haliangiales bacterium]